MTASQPDIRAGGDRGPALAPKDERRPETPSAKILDTFEAPHLHEQVSYDSDEFTALCPITGQPDWYEVRITLINSPHLLESKALKLYLGSYRQVGMFCEALASQICSHVKEATEAEDVDVTVVQKPRGGISIKSTSATRGGMPSFPSP